MDINGYQWISMDINGPNGYQWILYQWISMDTNGYQWYQESKALQSVPLYILQCHCSSAHLLHGCDPLDGRWIRESLPVARPYRTAQSHPSTLEVAWMLPTACKPAIASLRDSWKRKEKEGKTSETNLVSNGTTTNTKTGHTKKKTVAVLAVQGFNFLQHACTRFHKSMWLQKKAISNWASHGQHLPAEHNAEIPLGPVVQKGSKDTDPPPGWSAAGSTIPLGLPGLPLNPISLLEKWGCSIFCSSHVSVCKQSSWVNYSQSSQWPIRNVPNCITWSTLVQELPPSLELWICPWCVWSPVVWSTLRGQVIEVQWPRPVRAKSCSNQIPILKNMKLGHCCTVLCHMRMLSLIVLEPLSIVRSFLVVASGALVFELLLLGQLHDWMMQNNMGIAAALVLALLDSFRLTMNVSNSVLAIGVRQRKALACLLIAARCTNPWRSVAPNLKNIFQILSDLYTSRDMPFQARPRQPRHPFDCGSGLFTMWSKCKAVNGSRLKDLVDTLAKPPCHHAPTEIPGLQIWLCQQYVQPECHCDRQRFARIAPEQGGQEHPRALFMHHMHLVACESAIIPYPLCSPQIGCTIFKTQICNAYYPPFESFRVNR